MELSNKYCFYFIGKLWKNHLQYLIFKKKENSGNNLVVFFFFFFDISNFLFYFIKKLKENVHDK